MFEPPYLMADGEDYAFLSIGERPQLWLVERSVGGGWHWVREALRLGEISEAQATRH
ncbi:hypothetical protein [Bosea sp. BIWAKO-01]|uniref:hypothetical protein n=1 Tax=Bosea sp. BIWAKO-01 TaxID=506668 RepID=UPI00159F01E1|nr:hypothetical protein [Bosea sp. BIWAKO-01]